MGLGASLFLITVGAILDFAVHPTTNTHGIDINTIGLILMIVGVIGLLLSFLFWGSWGGFGTMSRGPAVITRRRRTYVEDPVVSAPVQTPVVTAAPRVRTVVEDDIV